MKGDEGDETSTDSRADDENFRRKDRMIGAKRNFAGSKGRSHVQHGNEKATREDKIARGSSTARGQASLAQDDRVLNEALSRRESMP
jgi:hypothetical protein